MSAMIDTTRRSRALAANASAPSCSVLLGKTKRPVSPDRSTSRTHQSCASSAADDVAVPFDIHTHRATLARSGAPGAVRSHPGAAASRGNYKNHANGPEFPAQEHGRRDAVPFPKTRRSTL
jgi:hypothetical protein